MLTVVPLHTLYPLVYPLLSHSLHPLVIWACVSLPHPWQVDSMIPSHPCLTPLGFPPHNLTSHNTQQFLSQPLCLLYLLSVHPPSPSSLHSGAQVILKSIVTDYSWYIMREFAFPLHAVLRWPYNLTPWHACVTRAMTLNQGRPWEFLWAFEGVFTIHCCGLLNMTLCC